MSLMMNFSPLKSAKLLPIGVIQVYASGRGGQRFKLGVHRPHLPNRSLLPETQVRAFEC